MGPTPHSHEENAFGASLMSAGLSGVKFSVNPICPLPDDGEKRLRRRLDAVALLDRAHRGVDLIALRCFEEDGELHLLRRLLFGPRRARLSRNAVALGVLVLAARWCFAPSG